MCAREREEEEDNDFTTVILVFSYTNRVATTVMTDDLAAELSKPVFTPRTGRLTCTFRASSYSARLSWMYIPA